MRRNY